MCDAFPKSIEFIAFHDSILYANEKNVWIHLFFLTIIHFPRLSQTIGFLNIIAIFQQEDFTFQAINLFNY
jgi:hypothetical protein